MPESDPDTKIKMLLILIIAITLIGSLVITALLIAWRRQVSRNARLIYKNNVDPKDNAWELSAERMVEDKMLEEDQEDEDEPLY